MPAKKDVDHVEEARKSKVVSEEQVTANNTAITTFFQGKDTNSKREEWYNPDFLESPLPPGVVAIFAKSITTYFSDKRWYGGGPIPYEMLYTIRNFRLINNIALIDALELALKSVKDQKFMAQSKVKKKDQEPFLLKIIRDCERKRIPQDHIGGLLIMYLELCERVVVL